MSGAQNPPATGGPGTSAPQVLPAGALEAISGEGALHFTALALKARLQTVFPPLMFDWHWLDGKMGKRQWTELTRRCPAICLGFAGARPLADNAEKFAAHSEWFLAVVTRNAGGPQYRVLGDRKAPGLLSLIRAATLAVHGFVINPPDTPWAASGAVRITDVSALAGEDWTDEALAVAGITLSVEYEETLLPGLDTPNHFDALKITWDFTPEGTWTDTIMEAT